MPVAVQREGEADSLIRRGPLGDTPLPGLSVDVVVFERAPGSLAVEAKG
jgi:hypothetical protein